MKDTRKISLGALFWVVLISGAHLALNFSWSIMLNDQLPEDKRRMYVAYIPVT
jgi:hypothetical protein